MKRISIGLFFTFLVLMLFSACQENLYIDWKLANEKWLANFVKEHKADTNFFTTASGLSYHKIYGGYPSSRQPNASSQITVSYKGTLINDSVFEDNSKVQVVLYLSQMIPAWREIFPQMHNGARFKMYVPSALAYDTATTHLPTIPPNSVLIFDINLIRSDF